MNDPLVDIGLLTVALVGLVWALTPLLLGLIGWRGLRYVAFEDPALAAAPDDDPDQQAKAEQLVALGFEPVGVAEETILFQGFEWWKSFTLRVWATKDRKVFASLYRLHPAEGCRVSLATMTSGGGLVCNNVPGAGVSVDEPNYQRREWPCGTSISDLLTQHHEEVERFCQKHGVRSEAPALADFTAAQKAHDERLLKGIWSHKEQLASAQLFFIPCLVIFLMLQPATLRNVALGLCASVAVYALVRIAMSCMLRSEVVTDNPPTPGRAV